MSGKTHRAITLAGDASLKKAVRIQAEVKTANRVEDAIKMDTGEDT
jgi:hypothetical protein